MLVLFTGPLGSSCNPEVGRPSAQEEKETRPLGPHLWETGKKGVNAGELEWGQSTPTVEHLGRQKTSF